MEAKEYKEIVALTAVFPKKVKNFGLAYGWLGMIDETAEFLNSLEDLQTVANKEAGDVFWYMAAICDQVGIKFEDVIDGYLHDSEFFMEINDEESPVYLFTGKIKKLYRDNKPIDLDDLTDVLVHHLHYINFNYQYAFDEDMDVNHIMKINYDKLMLRRETNTVHGDGDNRETDK